MFRCIPRRTGTSDDQRRSCADRSLTDESREVKKQIAQVGLEPQRHTARDFHCRGTGHEIFTAEAQGTERKTALKSAEESKSLGQRRSRVPGKAPNPKCVLKRHQNSLLRRRHCGRRIMLYLQHKIMSGIGILGSGFALTPGYQLSSAFGTGLFSESSVPLCG